MSADRSSLGHSLWCSLEDEEAPDEWTDGVFERYGDSELVAAYKDISRTKDLINQGTAVSGEAICAACDGSSLNSSMLDLLLSTGASPNTRRNTAGGVFSGVEENWDGTDIAPVFGVDKREWYPAHFVACCQIISPHDPHENKLRRDAVVDVLVRHDVDLYALFRQPLRIPQHYPFPGEGHDVTSIEGPDADERYLNGENPLTGMYDGEWQRDPSPDCGYGVRSLLHAVLEDGGYTKPFLKLTDLDVERRDPQGRTLLHSACRSSLGADTETTAIMVELSRPYRNQLTSEEPSETSLFHTLIDHGADMMAVDTSGKTILHHLLEARISHYGVGGPPMIRNSLRYVLQTATSLVNKPDRFGNCPLHYSLQRLRCFLALSIYLDPMQRDPPVRVIADLLDAGAIPTALDSRGNTAMHYLAESGLAEQYFADDIRTLAARLCGDNIDVNLRNMHGRTALELLLDDNGCLHVERQRTYRGAEGWRKRSRDEIDVEVFDMFDKAGARWRDRDKNGRTLLHFVAKHPTENAGYRCRYLLAKGIDPTVKDSEGRTPIDLVSEARNVELLRVLSSSTA